MAKSSPEAFRPMRLQGTEVEPGTPESYYDDPIELDDEANFQNELQGIINSERTGAVEGDSIIIM